MHTRSQFVIRFLLLICLVNTTLAKDNRPAADQRTSLTVTASTSSKGVRFTAPSSVVQIRLEVYSSTGRKVFDNEVRGGNVLDWHLQDGQTEPIAEGSYLCVVMAKSLSGRITQRIGSVTVEKNGARVQAIDAAGMTAQQVEAIGPVEEDSSLSVLGDDEPRTTTVIAHNGEDGQITRGRGALTFRIGDFFRGKEIEQMRLTPEGNLGIGVTNPQARLDVDGLIRSNQGIVFPDGTVQFSAASKTLGAKSSRADQKRGGVGDLQPQASGAGTQNFISKWTDNAGTLGDSTLFESVTGNVGIGTSSPAKRLHVSGGQIALDNQRFFYARRTNGQFQEAFGIDSNDDIVFNRNSLVNGVDADAPKAPSGLILGAGVGKFVHVRNSSNVTMLSFVEATGNVGIGDVAPSFRLHVVSPANVGLRVQTNALGGSVASFGGFGDFLVDAVNVVGGRVSVKENGNVGMGTNSPQARLDVRGNIKLGTNGQFFAPGGEENLRIIRGVISFDGSIAAGSGFQVSHTGVGEYLITFNTPFAGIPAVTVTTILPVFPPGQLSPPSIAQTQQITVNTVKIRTFVTLPGDDNGEVRNERFHFIAIGPR